MADLYLVSRYNRTTGLIDPRRVFSTAEKARIFISGVVNDKVENDEWTDLPIYVSKDSNVWFYTTFISFDSFKNVEVEFNYFITHKE